MLEFLKNLPDYVYYIVGAVIAVIIMLIVILSAKKSSKKASCGHENCDCHNHASSEQAEPIVESETETRELEAEEEAQPEQESEEQEEVSESDVKEEKSEEVKEAQPEISKKEKLNRYRVTYDKTMQNWVVKMDGATRASKRCATKEEALKVAKELAKKKDSKLSVHKKDGKFQKKANIK